MTRHRSRFNRLLADAGWTRVRARRHEVWRCPCGQHQTTLAVSPSDSRDRRNTRANLRRLGCPSLEGLL